MVTLTFKFNKEKLAQEGLTEDELLRPMREHAAKYGITETSKGVFEKDGEDDLGAIGVFIPRIIREDPHYIDLMDHWYLDVDGDMEDCVDELKEWRDSRGECRKYAMG